ncbi:MAG TPA: hypothetical protein VFJ71_09625, partial [Candidatus Limnocylindrales bacterium]|nr:hypothetical protein [Candidatus Limnocylindrales bacterium]
MPVRPVRVGPSLATAAPTFLVATVAVVVWAEARATAPVDVVPILFAGAAACILGLTRTRAPSLAWLAAIGGMFSAAAVPVAFARGADPAVVGVDAWLTWAAPAGVGAFVDLWIAAGYATRPDRRFEPASLVAAGTIVAWFGISVAVTILAVLAGEHEDPAFTWIDVASLPIAWFPPFLAILVGLGALADLRDALGRARDRLPPGASAWELGSATVRELVPGQAAAEETRAAAERVRLAGDLHASVVPSLRRAIEEAEGGADPGVVLRHLRAADLELERLMADRWPIVLET